MPQIHEIIDRGKTEYFKWQYMRAINAVLDTPPVKKGSLPFTVLSMVHHRDVKSYLLALKSFALQANPEKIVVVCDPTIDDIDKACFVKHIPHIELRAANEFTHADIPRGGTWERLFAISEYVQHTYVVQLDADTLTLSGVNEVKKSVDENNGFVLGEESNQRILSIAETSTNAKVRLLTNSHIQTRTEAALSDLPLLKQNRYLRGCSGFAGYPRECDLQTSLLEFSKMLNTHFGDLWNSWGTEQITSNYLLANLPGTKILPFPEYGTPDVYHDSNSFIHFIGSMRFISNRYRNESLRMINLLKSNDHESQLNRI